MDKSETARLLAAAATLSPNISANDDRTVTVWHAIIGDLDYSQAAWALREHYRESVYAVTPAELVQRVKTARARDLVPHHLRCASHPAINALAAQCPHCARLIDGRRAAPLPAAELIARVRAIAAQAREDARERDRARSEALQQRADAGYERFMRRAAERDTQTPPQEAQKPA